MFCFRCKVEFQRGITRCSECDSLLVHRFPDTPRFSETVTELVAVRRYNNKIDADLAKTTLNAAGIQSFVRSDDYGGSAPHLSFSSGVEIVVRSEDAQDADAILNCDTGHSL
jgi:hypothetical protein